MISVERPLPESPERALRERLGIPMDARQVLLFGETSHWDPNWLYTSEEYYERRIEKILDEVLEELEREPRRVFSIECLFFFQLYWDRKPANHERLRELVNEGRIAFSGTGITTPDTVIPSTEAILRDYLLGQEWLRKNGMNAEPRVAYLPDNFGHSPALPSILRSLGFDRAAITRIDGMYFVGTDYRLPSAYPLKGSSADTLTRLHTADFVWRAPDRSEVVCHWNAFTYFQGDLLAHIGIIRWMGIAFGVPWRTGRHIARRISKLVAQLGPLSPTPYLFCPIGCDFNGPIHSLLELLDRYNRTHYPDTGVWAVNATIDDHMELLSYHKDELPVLELDPNPYWMGFYATRPGAKWSIHRIARKLVLAEKLSVLSDADGSSELARAWDRVVVSNHHDFVTGTSPDRVYEKEQRPWLEEAEALADEVLDRVRPARGDVTVPAPAPPRWKLDRGRLEISTPDYEAVLDEKQGGCIVSFRAHGRELLTGPANDLVAYEDTGGLWRMGHEYLGGTFRELTRASRSRARISAFEKNGLLEIEIASELCDRRVFRRMWCRADSPIVRMQIDGSTTKMRTITCAFPTISSARTMTMNVPGGVIERAQNKLYDPTFWPARSFVHLEDEAFGLAAFLGGPASVALTAAGTLEWVVFRHTPIERAFGLLPLVAHPASGSETRETHFDYAVWLTGPGDYRAHQLPMRVRQALRAAMFPPGAPDLDAIASSVVESDSSDVLVSALKRADRGEGIIARLRAFFPSGRGEARIHCSARKIVRARLCDARERDISELTVDEDGHVRVPISGSITSVRLFF